MQPALFEPSSIDLSETDLGGVLALAGRAFPRAACSISAVLWRLAACGVRRAKSQIDQVRVPLKRREEARSWTMFPCGFAP